MMNVEERTPYNKLDQEISFKTNAETVYYNDRKLSDILEDWAASLRNLGVQVGSINISGGRGIISLTTVYACLPRGIVSAYLAREYDQNNSVNWESSSPPISEENPHLWKKVTTVWGKSLDEKEPPVIEYQYCGSKGDKGVDGDAIEWVFKLDYDTAAVEAALTAELAAAYTNVRWDDNDFVPIGWADDMLPLDSSNSKVLWCATRFKKSGKWLPFENLHVFNRSPKDGDGWFSNSIYATVEKTDDFSLSAKALAALSEIRLEGGIITNIPNKSNTDNIQWYDSVVNNIGVVYMMMCYFSLNGELVKMDAPIKISGEAGIGSDGEGVEFVYYTTENDLYNGGDWPPTELKTVAPYSISSDSYNTWSNKASDCAISEAVPYKFASTRQGHYTSETDWEWGGVTAELFANWPADRRNSWNYGWSEPFVWSSWGADGVDGDGVQYVYLRLTEEEFLFVNADPSRWNFEGGVSESDPGDITDPTNPNNPINFTYIYSLDNPVYNYTELVGAQETRIRLTGVKGHYTIINGEGKKIVDNEPFTISFYITLSDSDFNDDKVNTKQCSLSYTYSGPYLPENSSGLGSITGTVNFTRDKLIEENTSYYIYYRVGDANSSTAIPANLCPEGVNPKIVLYDGTSDIEITAPTISGYIINGESSDTVTPTHNTISFYYTKI